MYTPEEIKEILLNSFRWKRPDPSLPNIYSVLSNKMQLATVTADELSTLDKRLPVVLDKLFETSAQGDAIMSNWGEATWALWHEDLPIVPVAGDYECNIHKLRSYNRGSDWEHAHFNVAFSITKTVTANIDGIEQVIQYTPKYGNDEIAVEKKWLNEKFPGWEERYTALELLGETGNNLLQGVFLKPMLIATIKTDEIDFNNPAL